MTISPSIWGKRTIINGTNGLKGMSMFTILAVSSRAIYCIVIVSIFCSSCLYCCCCSAFDIASVVATEIVHVIFDAVIVDDIVLTAVLVDALVLPMSLIGQENLMIWWVD